MLYRVSVVIVMEQKPGPAGPWRLILLVSVSLLLSACGYKEGEEGEQVNCSMPCLLNTPTLDVTSISSATGGTVEITFTIDGSVFNVDNVLVELKSTEFLNHTVAGNNTLTSPTKATNTLAITVNAGNAQDTYYPKITFTNKVPSNSGAMYYLDWTKSDYLYTFAELVDILGIITGKDPVLSDMAFPSVTVTP